MALAALILVMGCGGALAADGEGDNTVSVFGIVNVSTLP